MTKLRPSRLIGAAACAALALTAAACGDGGTEARDNNKTADADVVRVVTHDSFVVTDELKAAFEKKTGMKLELLPSDDAGAMVNQLILTKDAPLGDAVAGIDNTFASRAIEEGILAPYTSPDGGEAQKKYAADDSGTLTAVDFSDVCVNVDKRAYKDGAKAPASLEDLAKPEYKDQLVVENPATSSPGLAFMLATVGAFGEDGWLDYWKNLKANGVTVESGWEEAYNNDFSGPSSAGSRPLVVSYASSPPSEIPDGETEPATAALLDTCFRQVEYAGVLKGAANPEGAKAFVDFMVSKDFQDQIPGTMWVYPVNPDATLPADWESFAPLADKTWEVPSATIAEKRDSWIREWTDTVLG